MFYIHFVKKSGLLSNPFSIFYFVFAYTIAFSIWWAYLLFAKNEAAFKEKIELDKIHFTERYGNVIAYETTKVYQLQFNKYKRQRVMIITEGGVFIALLLFGLLQVRRVFKKEISLVSQQKNFLLSITHELKSPLASIKVALQTMGLRNLEQEKSEKLINNSLNDIDRLESLVENILLAAKIERKEHGLSKIDIDVSELVEKLTKRFVNNKKKVQFFLNIQSGIILQTDPVGFTSIIINLIENALKYSSEGKKIEVVLEQADTNILLQIKDEGIGIPEAEREKVFEKFYRIGNEETRRTKGTGLGLYIVKRFVEIYEGEISVSDNQPSGTVFTLSFPM